MSAALRIIFFSLLCFTPLSARAAEVDFYWAHAFGSVSEDKSNGIALDSMGNVYTTGYFEGTIDFDPGVGVLELTSRGENDIFVQKLDARGNLAWAYHIGGEKRDEGDCIAVDEAGNVYISGSFRGLVDFDPGVGIFTLNSSGPNDLFVEKFDSNGNFLWARTVGGLGGGVPYAIAVDRESNIYITGDFTSTADFDPGDGVFSLTSEGGNDIFVLKLDALGNFVWARGMGGRSFEFGQDVAVDSMGNVCTTGYFQGTVDFDPGAGTYNLVSKGYTDMYVQKLDSGGNFVWAHRIGGGSFDFGFGIAVDDGDNVYTTGSFLGYDDFDPGPASRFLYARNDDIFVWKLNAYGKLVWARNMGGDGNEAGLDIVVDGEGNVYNTGGFVGTAYFGPNSGAPSLTSAGLSDIFVQKLDASGALVWARRMGGPNAENGFGIAIDDLGSVCLTGAFKESADFDPGAATFTVTSAGDQDGFVVKLGADVTPPNATNIVAGIVGATNSESIGFTVTFDDAIKNFDAPSDLIIVHNGTTSTGATFFSGPSEYLVSVTGLSGEGSFTITVNTLSDVQDLAGNRLLTSVTSTAVAIDRIPPNVSIGAPTGSPLNSSGMASFPVTIDGASGINFTSSHVTLNHSGTAGGSAVVIDGASLNPTVQVSGVTGDGSYTVSVAAEVAADALGNKSLAAGPSSPVAVDNTPPAVSIGTPSLATVNSTGMAYYPITISGGDIHNLASDDVTLNHSGTAGGSVVVVDGDSASPTVQVSGVTGDGSYTVSIAGGIAADALGNASLATGPGGAVTVDNAPPTVSIGAPTGGVVNSSRTATYPVTVSGAKIVNLTSGDVSIQHQGTSGGTVNIVTGRSSTPLVQVSGVTGNGRYTIRIAKGIATDAASNESLATGPSADAVTVDNTAPTVSIGAPLGTPVNRSGTVSFPVTVSGASVVNLTRGEVSLSRNGASGGSVNILNGASTNPTVQVSGLTGNGTFTISIADGIATDAAANDSTLAGPSVAATVDNASPIFSRIVVSPAEASEGDTVNIGFESSEPIVGDPEVTVNGNPASRTAKAAFAYEYTVQSSNPPGPATIEIEGIDRAGNNGILRSTTALTITETVSEGEGDVVGEGESEGEGEDENPPAGCGGCNATGGPMEKSLGDWFAALLGFAVLVGAHLSLRSRLEA